jgi:hypothetical protein
LCITAKSGTRLPEWVIFYRPMSVVRRLCPQLRKSDRLREIDVKGQNRTHAAQQKGLSFDHLVGAGKQRRGDVDTNRPGGLQVDDKLELGWQYDRQVGGLFSFEDAAGINPD